MKFMTFNNKPKTKEQTCINKSQLWTYRDWETYTYTAYYGQNSTKKNYKTYGNTDTYGPATKIKNHTYQNKLQTTSRNPSYRDWETDRKSTRLNSSHITRYRMPSSA